MSAEPSAEVEPLRVLVLWVRLSGYLDACLRELGALPGVEVKVVYRTPFDSAPFDADRFTSAEGGYRWDDRPDPARLDELIESFRPDAVVVCGWTWPEYRRAAGSLAGRALRVLCLDNQWMGTPHQLLGAAASRHYLRPNYDVVFFPGDSQARFARRMGYGDHRHLYGLYCADYNRFAAVVPPGGRDPLRSFGFVGRLVEDKGVDVLAEAYQRYRRAVTDPWPLLVAGTGPLASVLHDQPGIDVRGFLQPDDLPGFFAEAGAFVLPSRFEPWGVAVHEAAAAGLPIITTPAAGAASRLLLDGYNGLLIPADDVDALAEALERFSGYDDERRRQMSAASSNLAQQFTPRRWATYVAERLRGYGARWGHAPSLGS